MTRRTNEKRTGSAKVALRFLFPLPATLLFFLTAFLFPVTETYLGNLNDFSVSFSALVGSLLLVWGGAALITALLIGLLPKTGRIAVTSVFFLLGLIAYLQSNYLNGSMISMTGEAENYSSSLVAGNIAVWAGVLAVGIAAAVLLLCFHRGRVLLVAVVSLSLLLLFMQTVGAAVGAATTSRERGEVPSRGLTNEGELSVASDRNVVLFILDTAAGEYVRSALVQEPELFNGFDGFTYYPDCLPVYTRTYPAIPYYLTGGHCYFDRSASTYINEAADASTYLSEMHDRGVTIGVYTPDPPLVGDALLPLLENATFKDEKLSYDPLLLVRYTVGLSMKRISPYALKASFYERVGELNTRTVKSEYDPPSKESAFYAALRENGLTVGEGDGCFRFFHFFGPHPGTQLRPDGTTVGRYTSEPEAIRGDFTIIRAYLAELKRLGLYDKTTVIITADHGDSRLSAYEEGGYLDVVRGADMLMMVKPASSTEGFTESSVPVSGSDLFATVYDGLGLDPAPYGTPIYELPAGERTRYLYYTALYHDRYGEIARMTYRVTGDCRDAANYRWTGEYYDIVHSYFKVSPTRFTPDLMMQEPSP